MLLRRHFPLNRVGPWLQRSLQRRISAGVLAVSALAVALVTLLVYRQHSSGLQEVVMDRLAGIADARVADVDRWVNDELSGLGFVANLPLVANDIEVLQHTGPAADLALARLTNTLVAASHGRIGTENIFVLSAIGGRVVASTDSRQVGSYHTSELYFERGLEGPFIQDVYPSARTGRPALTVAVPVRRQGDTAVAAVMVANLDLRRMDQLVVQPEGPLPVEVYLVNRYAEFVTSERFGSDEFRRGVHTAGIDSVLTGHSGQGLYRNYNGVPVIGAYRWMPERQLGLLVESPQSAALAPARRALLMMLLTGVIAITILAVALQWVTKRAVEPILEVTRSAERIAGGDLGAETPVRTDDEVGVLARSFNAMTAHLRTLYADLNDQIAATSRMVDALQKNRTLMQSIVDNSTAAIAVVAFSDRLLLVNSHLAEISRDGHKAAVGRKLSDIFSDGSAAAMRSACQEVRTSRKPVEVELEITTAEGDRNLLALCFPLFDAGGVPYAIGLIATDQTERRRAESERLSLEAQVRHSQKLESLGVMAGGIAHDFNNIMGAVLGHAELAIEALDDPAEARASLEQVVAATRRASDLTRQMLAYAGKASFGRDVIDLNHAVREISDLAMVGMSKKCRVVRELSSEAPWILADGSQISQVILNLLTNASDAIGDHEGTVTLTTSLIELSHADLALSFGDYDLSPGRYAELKVTDTGIGMDQDTLYRIFDPFFSTKTSGHGLGLAAVLGIVRSSGAGLSVTSRPSHGTTFRVIFPAQRARRTPSVTHPTETTSGDQRVILVVDDESMLRSLASRALRKAGFEVLEAADGSQAWKIFQERGDRISAIVLDMTMPGMSGQEVLTAIRRVDTLMPVVLTSGYDSQDTAATRAADTRVQFLQKPYAPRDLVDRVLKAAANASLTSS